MFNWRSQCLQIDIVKRRLVFLSRYQISVTGENAASKTECPSEARRWPKTGSKLEDGGAFTATTGWDKSRILISVRWWRWQLCQRRRSGTFMLTLEPGSSMTLLFYYLALLQNDTDVTSQCMQFIFGDKGPATCLNRECPTCDWKRGEGKGKKSLLVFFRLPIYCVYT